jgi:hypothetical protein
MNLRSVFFLQNIIATNATPRPIARSRTATAFNDTLAGKPLLVFWVGGLEAVCDEPDGIGELPPDGVGVVAADGDAVPPPCTSIGDAVSVCKTTSVPPAKTEHSAMLLSMAHDSIIESAHWIAVRENRVAGPFN